MYILVCKNKSKFESEIKIFNYIEGEEVFDEVYFLNVDNLKDISIYLVINI